MYCNVVCGNCRIQLADKLQKLQNRAAPASSDFLKLVRKCVAAVPNFKWKNLSLQRDIHKWFLNPLLALHREYLSWKFIARSNTTSYTFRDSVNKLTIPEPHKLSL